MPPEVDIARVRASVSGVVQGVGFRPFVYNLAIGLELSGWVTNTAAGVELEVVGAAADVELFFDRLRTMAPPLAMITGVQRRDLEPGGDGDGFEIRASRAGTRRTLISPDAAVCEACLAEMRDPADRRFGYAFINCTHCGPRYTIIQDIPYDRPQTTMSPFTMCAACQAEYDDPADRRFHAQPNACPACGPRLWLAGPDGVEIPCHDPVAAAAEALRQGKVLAVKGLGGFHLACDAFNHQAVAALRRRKHREEKPLAVMVPDLPAARRLVELDPVAAEALTGRQRPIVLAPVRPGAGVAPAVAPRNRLLGVMLPYTPLHHLIMDQGFDALVMTSGNVSEEPICLDNREAAERIGSLARRGAIADLMLLHDREIYLRSDDSVVRSLGGVLRQYRRSRGYVPAPLMIAESLAPPDHPPILAAGAHQKNTLCLLRGGQAFVSQHVGDLANLETLEFFELTAGHLARILEAEPAVIACDLHPDYLSTGWAQKQGLPLVRVQHHHAHIVAVMAEHSLAGPVLGLALDGTGFGPDGTIWGGELLVAHLDDYRRVGRLRRFSLPGSEAAVKQPWRVGLALLLAIFGPAAGELDLELTARHAEHLELVGRMIAAGLNTPRTSSLGRLFDGVAAIAGVRGQAAYEGQAAVELEQAIDPAEGGAYGFGLHRRGGRLVLDWEPMLRELAADAAAGRPAGIMAARFHNGLVESLAEMAALAAGELGLEQVCLGGGCMMNAELLVRLPAELERRGLKAYTAAAVPANDGGVSLGQAVAAAAAWARGLTGRRQTVLGRRPEK